MPASFIIHRVRIGNYNDTAKHPKTILDLYTVFLANLFVLHGLSALTIMMYLIWFTYLTKENKSNDVNELYKSNESQCVLRTFNNHPSLNRHCDSISYFTYILLTIFLILLKGDTELNPGPSSELGDSLSDALQTPFKFF
jgi:hypothetical protein